MCLAISSLSSLSPEFAVYTVLPSSSAEIAVLLIAQGVGKSGSPTPRLITPSSSCAISKNFLIPDGLIFWILSESTEL